MSGARARAEQGELAFGTIDSFVVSQLTSGAVHATDVTNASRTLLMNLARGEWDPELCDPVPRAGGRAAEDRGERRGASGARGASDSCPTGSRSPASRATSKRRSSDRPAFAEGDAKCTYGTGAFALMNIGQRPILSEHGLVTTAAWRIKGKTTYALEGSAFIAGAAVQWLRDGLGIIKSAKEIEALARTVSSSEGVVFVPALAGLGAPHWDQDARGSITGLTRGTTSAHLARATLEGIAFEVRDLLDAMSKDARRPVARLRVDGGAAENDLLMQFQADIAGVVVERAADVESTGRGAACSPGSAQASTPGLDEVARVAAAAKDGARFESRDDPRRSRGAHGAVVDSAHPNTRRARPCHDAGKVLACRSVGLPPGAGACDSDEYVLGSIGNGSAGASAQAVAGRRGRSGAHLVSTVAFESSLEEGTYVEQHCRGPSGRGGRTGAGQ